MDLNLRITTTSTTAPLSLPDPFSLLVCQPDLEEGVGLRHGLVLGRGRGPGGVDDEAVLLQQLRPHVLAPVRGDGRQLQRLPLDEAEQRKGGGSELAILLFSARKTHIHRSGTTGIFDVLTGGPGPRAWGCPSCPTTPGTRRARSVRDVRVCGVRRGE